MGSVRLTPTNESIIDDDAKRSEDPRLSYPILSLSHPILVWTVSAFR